MPIPRSKLWRYVVEAYPQGYLCTAIADKDLRNELSPTYPLGTKQILFDSDFSTALTRPNVQLVTDPIHSVSDEGIETDEGARPMYVIFYATGLRASQFLVPMRVQGSNG